jgi:hypothetical protein
VEGPKRRRRRRMGRRRNTNGATEIKGEKK